MPKLTSHQQRFSRIAPPFVTTLYFPSTIRPPSVNRSDRPWFSVTHISLPFPSPSSLLPNLIADLRESRNRILSHSSPSNPRRVFPGWVSRDKTLLWEGKKVSIRRRGEVCVLLFLDLDIDGGSSNQNEVSSAQHAEPVNALCECPGPLSPPLRLIDASGRLQGCVLVWGPKTTNSINLQSRTDAVAAFN